MKVIKSDGRYNLYNQGFTTILEFNMKIRPQRDEFHNLIAVAKRIYGDARDFDAEKGRWIVNEHYRTQLMSDRKRRRIYLRNEQEVTMLMLQA
jgi:hypothetical protein